jgi:hypothetical protein
VIPKPSVPIQIQETQEEKSLAVNFDDYENEVARWNSVSRKWEFKNGQMMDCAVINVFSAREE